MGCPCVGDHLLKVCERDMLQTACSSFTIFTTCVQLETKMYWLDFEVKRSKQGLGETKWSKSHFGNFVVHTFKRHGHKQSFWFAIEDCLVA